MAGVSLSGHLCLLLTEPNNATSLESHSNGWGWRGSHLTAHAPLGSHANAEL